jgi:hypothetical protein
VINLHRSGINPDKRRITMKKRIVKILIAAALMLIGAAAVHEPVADKTGVPWCPPFCR